MPAYDVTKLQIVAGMIHYKIRQQDGSFQEMKLNDSLSNRLFVQWVQVHD